MIIGLYKLLNQVITRGFFGFRRINVTHCIFLSVGYLIFRGQINMLGTAGIIIPTIILSTGVLIPPYAYLINIFKLKINTKIFKKSIYIYCSKHGNITLRKKNFATFSEPIGLIVDNKIYLEEPIPYLKNPILWGMEEKITYIKNFEEFEKGITKEDDLETIKRKIILNTLEN